MNIPIGSVYDAALGLPESQRVELAYRLLESLDPPGKEISGGQFGTELRHRIEAYKQDELDSYSIDEARHHVKQKLAEGRSP